MMFFSISNIEKAPLLSIEFTNPRRSGGIQANEIIKADIIFSELKYNMDASGVDVYPTISKFLAKARFYVAIYSQHSDRNPAQDKSLCVQISFTDDSRGKCIEIEAFIQSEILTSALLLSKQSIQTDFHVTISDGEILRNLERKLLESSKSSASCASFGAPISEYLTPSRLDFYRGAS